jgi:hypothetical protein
MCGGCDTQEGEDRNVLPEKTDVTQSPSNSGRSRKGKFN